MLHRCACAALLLLFLLAPFSFAHAQGGGETTCPALVESALAAAGEACADLERNTACYGHSLVEATFFEDRDDLVFSAPADRVALADLQTLTTAPLDGEANTWGVALLHLQANLPDTLPGQAVTMLLMGDATLENDVTPEAEDSPMQAFTFTSGLSAPACAEAPNSLVIHSPTGEEVSLTINDLELTLGSTVVLTTAETATAQVLVLTLLQGHLQATIGGETITLEAPPETTQAFPVLAVTLNDAGRVDADSRIVALPDAADSIAPTVAGACAAVSAGGMVADLTLPDCELPLETFEAGGATGACKLTARQNVNLRGGPGTNYAIVGSLAAEGTASADGYAQGADGFRWWRLGEGQWVRADLVDATGACAGLGTVAIPEPPPTPRPASNAEPAGNTGPSEAGMTAADAMIVLNGPTACGGGIPSTRGTIWFVFGNFGWTSLPDAEAGRAIASYWMTIDGQSVPASLSPAHELMGGYGFRLEYYWPNPPVGPHTIAAGTTTNCCGTNSATCVIDVRP